MSLYKGNYFIAGTPDLSEYAKTNDILNAIYPVGSVYLSTTSTCPMQSLIVGSAWESIGSSIITAVNSVSIATNNQQIIMKNDEGEYGLIARYNGGTFNIGGHTFTSGGSNCKFGSQTGLSASVSKTSISVYIFKRTA